MSQVIDFLVDPDTLSSDNQSYNDYFSYLIENNVPHESVHVLIEDLDDFVNKFQSMLINPKMNSDERHRQWYGRAKDHKAMIELIKDTFKCDVDWCQQSRLGINFGHFSETSIIGDIGNQDIRVVRIEYIVHAAHNQMYKLDDIINKDTMFFLTDSQ